MLDFDVQTNLGSTGLDDLDDWALVFDVLRHALPLRGIADSELPTVKVGGIAVTVDARNSRLPIPNEEEWLTPDEYTFFKQYFIDGRTVDDIQSEWDVSRPTLFRMRHTIADKLAKVLET